MIANIVDSRKNRYSIHVDAVFEPSWHDNSIEGSTKFENNDEFSISWEYNITVAEAINKANTYKTEVTVFLYDAGSEPC